jgi:hypothetical protein
MRRGSLTSAEVMARLRRVHAHQEKIPRTMAWLMAEASRPLEGLEPAVRGGAPEAIGLTGAADVGHLCQIRVEPSAEP